MADGLCGTEGKWSIASFAVFLIGVTNSYFSCQVWTVVSILNFTLVPVEHRLTVSATVGLFWGIYLSLLAPA